jgi:hypothetical protein
MSEVQKVEPALVEAAPDQVGDRVRVGPGLGGTGTSPRGLIHRNRAERGRPIPGLGFLPVNAYLLRAEQPLLVDSGLPTSQPEFLEACGRRSSPPTCDGSTSRTRTATTPAA